MAGHHGMLARSSEVWYIREDTAECVAPCMEGVSFSGAAGCSGVPVPTRRLSRAAGEVTVLRWRHASVFHYWQPLSGCGINTHA